MEGSKQLPVWLMEQHEQEPKATFRVRSLLERHYTQRVRGLSSNHAHIETLSKL